MAAKQHRAFKLELSFDEHMLNGTIKDMVVRMVTQAGGVLVAKAGLLANPEVLHVDFEEWTPEGWQPVDVSSIEIE